MKFSSLFKVIGEETEIEIYQKNPSQYICSVTTVSRVPRKVYGAEVVSVNSAGFDRLVVIIGKEEKFEYKHQSIIQHGRGTVRSDPSSLSGGEVLEDKAAEGKV